MFFCFCFLQNKVSAAQILNDNIAGEKSNYVKLLEEEREASLQNKARVTADSFAFCFINCPWDEQSCQKYETWPIIISEFWLTVVFSLTDWKIGEIEWKPEAQPKKGSGSSCQGTNHCKTFYMIKSKLLFQFLLKKRSFFTEYHPPGWGQDSGRCSKRSTQMSWERSCSTEGGK